MTKTQMVYLPAIAAAIVDMNERDCAARHTFQRRALPLIDLELVGVFSANGRRRICYRIIMDGEEVGTAIERPDQTAKPWRLTMPGACGNLGHISRDALLATVRRVLVTGQVWES
jgi:hypothetical protein